MYDRLRCYTDKVAGMLAENVCFGSSHPVESIILMLIDDGDPTDRKMRENLLDPSHKFVGLATGKHKLQVGMCTAMLCLEFLDMKEVQRMHKEFKGELIDDEDDNY